MILPAANKLIHTSYITFNWIDYWSLLRKSGLKACYYLFTNFLAPSTVLKEREYLLPSGYFMDFIIPYLQKVNVKNDIYFYQIKNFDIRGFNSNAVTD